MRGQNLLVGTHKTSKNVREKWDNIKWGQIENGKVIDGDAPCEMCYKCGKLNQEGEKCERCGEEPRA